jgi:hypothetical protein
MRARPRSGRAARQRQIDGRPSVRWDRTCGCARAALLALAAALLGAIGGPAGAASAAVSASRITSPASPAYPLYDETLAAHQPAFTVSGTTTGTGNVALRCYYGVGPNEYKSVVKEVPVSAGAFAVTVDTEALNYAPCVLRAVPVSDTKAHPPGSASEEAKDPYQGPVIAGSRFELESNEAVDDYYEFEARSMAGYFDIEAAGACGLVESALYATSSLVPSADLFGCDATFFEENEPSSGSATRSDLRVDGVDAYMPTTARYLEEDLATKIAGAPAISVSETFDGTSGLVTIHEVDPLVRCSPSASFPPTKTGCKEFVSAGVQLERTWQTSGADRVASMTDNWTSTDGAAHTLSALYEQWFAANTEAGGAFELPGTGGFAPTTKGELVAPPTGAGAIYYEEDAEAPTVGDGEHPLGAVVYDRPPSEPLSFHEGTDAGKKIGTEFNMPYAASIPASGAYTLRMGFVQAYTLAEVQSESEALEAGFAATPSVTAPSSAAPSPAPPAPPAPPAAHIVRIGAATGAHGRASVTLACAGAAGSTCEVLTSLTTVERTREGRPVALSAANRHTRIGRRRVVVGTSRTRIAAGRRVRIEIALNATGRRLLARFGRLPVRLRVILVSAGHRTAVLSRKLTIDRGARRAKARGRRSRRGRSGRR